ncbi:response regulator [Paenibacillus flagellatus]|uniref:Response regulatory domain-containing protein n=1 Tax=Paenibacillus flagellatus TaxID=2211139 RepID=A0A2V5JZY4_9BACL|nr:response regulator [Paenibacillus flagellatus]PYI52525.1 hypothetical protein DLM86_20325 [Paenibacillus flagellatus]
MRAIVVDDEPFALQSMERMLQRAGVEVAATFPDARKLLEQADRLRPDAAFLDIEMPGLNGLEAAVRLQELCPDIEIVFVTAYDHYAVAAFELEAIDYLLKPVQPSRLDKTLARLRRQAEERADARSGPRPIAGPVSAPVSDAEAGHGDEAPATAAPAPTLLCCFHHLGVIGADGVPVDVPWRTMKAKELYAYLAHRRGAAVSKEAILDLLWPDAGDEKGLANLHTAVYQLRKTLKAAGIASPIDYVEGRYRLEHAAIELEADRWEAGLERASRSADGDADRELLRLLLDVYRGDYFEQEGYLWAENERERLRIKWLEHALAAAGRFERGGRMSEAIRLYQRVQERFPLLEESYMSLMRLYDRLGRPAEVKGQYDKLRRKLQDELGTEPAEPIAAWYAGWSSRRKE